jgi:ribosomal protein L37AE/L43A
MMKIECPHCGGENVMRDAWVVWSVPDQRWEIKDIFDQYFCEDCQGETLPVDVEIQDPT